MKKLYVVILALAVIAGVVGLIVATRSGSESVARTETPPPSEPAATPAASQPTGSSRPAPRPTIADDSADTPADSDQPTYKIYHRDDGTEVRDFRSGDHSPVTTPPRPRRGKRSRVDAKVIGEIRSELLPQVRKCSETINKEKLDENAVVQAQIAVNIKDGQLQVARTTVQVRGVDEADVQDLKDCVGEPLQAMTIAAEGHKDVEEYRLTYPFRLSR